MGTTGMPPMADLMNMGRGGFGMTNMTSETWGQVAARASMLAAQLRELETAGQQGSSSTQVPNARPNFDEASLRAPEQQQQPQQHDQQQQHQQQSGMWLPPNPMQSFPSKQDVSVGMPIFGQPGHADRLVQDYRIRMSQHMPGFPGSAMTQEDLIRSFHGLPPGALLAAGIPMFDGRRPKAGMAAETRRQNDKEKKRRKRERIGELVKSVRPGSCPIHHSQTSS
jgi:hypothetical protein